MRLLRCFFFLSLLCLHASVLAAPWAPVGDVRLRSALGWLADRGCLAAPVTSWPLMWADTQLRSDAPNACQLSAEWRYLSAARQQAQQAMSARLDVAATTQVAAFHFFAEQPREQREVGVGLAWQGRHFALAVSPSAVFSPYDMDAERHSNRWRWGGSYVAARLGNWWLGIGSLDRWWGPGHASSLLLGNNTRPVPALFISRRQAHASTLPLLSWLGPWTLKAFVGQLEQQRLVPDAKLIAMRVAFKPASWLELGLARVFQWGGEGRPQSASSFWDAFAGRDNCHQNCAMEPGNQLGGIDFRVALPLGRNTVVGLYGQLTGEDEAGYMPSRNIVLLGAEAGGHWLVGRQQLWLEYTNTTVDAWQGDALPNLAYGHHIYRNGYRYYGRSLGSSWETDSRVATLGAQQFFTNRTELLLTVSHVRLNKDATLGAAAHYRPRPVALATTDETLTRFRVGYGLPLWHGRLMLTYSWLDQPLDTVALTYDSNRVGLSWHGRIDFN